MIRHRSAAALAPLLLAIATPVAAAQSAVRVVDDSGGPGIQYTTIQAAIEAAADGDVILVKPGTYSDASINDTSVTIVADSGGPVRVVDGIAIRNLSSQRRVVLRGLRAPSGSEEGLQVKNCAGQVWIEDCILTGAQGDGSFALAAPHEDGFAGALIANSARVSFHRCTIAGGAGDDYDPLFAIHGNGAAGLQTLDSDVAVYDCALSGGRGGDVFDDDFAVDGGNGGAGVSGVGGSLFFAGCTVAGGSGGVGGEDFDIFAGYSCGLGGAGGNGLVGANSGQTILLQLLDTTISEGVGGPPYPGAPCGAGANGTAVVAPPTSVGITALPSASLASAGPVRAGQQLALEIDAPPGSAYAIGLATLPDQVLLPALSGVLLLEANVVLLPIGLVGPSGIATVSLSTNLALPALGAVTAHAQAAVLTPTLSAVLTGGTQVLVLDPAL